MREQQHLLSKHSQKYLSQRRKRANSITYKSNQWWRVGGSNERMILLSHHGRRNQMVSRGTPRSRRLIPEPEPAQQQQQKRETKETLIKQHKPGVFQKRQKKVASEKVPVLEGESKHPPPPHLYAPHNPLSLPPTIIYISTLSPWKTIIINQNYRILDITLTVTLEHNDLCDSLERKTC